MTSSLWENCSEVGSLSEFQKAHGRGGWKKTTSLQYPVEVVIGWGSNTIEALTRNISLSGMFIETPQPLWLQAEFTVRLSLPEPIELDCIVKRVEPGRGMGVEFKDLLETEREQLKLLVASLAENDAMRGEADALACNRKTPTSSLRQLGVSEGQ